MQVAALAGVPKDVIRRAKVYLKSLESLQLLHTDSPQAQLPLTVEEPQQEDPLRDAIRDLEPDSMSPREALEALYKLKEIGRG